MMKSLFMLFCGFAVTVFSYAQTQQKSPCLTDDVYRQFDFWIGMWDVYDPKGNKAGDSNIELILDSCIILENWKSATPSYAGKSFNTYNNATKQWQQTWVDNVGGTTEFLRGHAEKDKMIFNADNVKDNDGKSFLRRLTFFKLSDRKVRQLGERSDDDGKTWTTEYDLEYRRKK